MPQTQISLPRRAGRELSASPSRQREPASRGRLERLLAGRRGELRADAAVRAGETVTVTGAWTRRRPRAPFSYSFVVGDPDPIARLPEPARADRAARHGAAFRLGARARRRRSLTVTVDLRRPRGATATSSSPPTRARARRVPTIFDPSGRLVWFEPLPPGTFAANVRVQRYRGRPVLTWWQGTISHHGFGLGEGEIYSHAPTGRIATVHAGDGLAEDLHELAARARRARALITAWKPLYCDLASVGGPASARGLRRRRSRRSTSDRARHATSGTRSTTCR